MKTFTSILTLPFILLFLSNINYGQPAGLDLLWEKEADVRTMKFIPDGSLLVTGGRSNLCSQYSCGQIRVWEVEDSTLLHTIEGWSIGLTNDIDISNNGQIIISGHGSVYCNAFTGCVRDRAGQYEYSINGLQNFANTDPGGIIYSIAFSPNDSIIAAGTGYNNSGHISIYDSQYNLLRTLLGHSGNTTSLVFTPDAQYLISGGYDGYIRVWNYLTGNIVNYFQHGTYTNGGTSVRLSISSDGQYLASTGNGYNVAVKIWRISDWSLVHTFDVSDPYGSSSSTEFSPNGVYLASLVSFNSHYGLIRFYEVETGELVREFIDTTGSSVFLGGIRSIAFSPSANNSFAYSVGFGSYGRLRLVSVDLDLLEEQTTPVELASFNASLNNNSITLNWITSSELNNRGFEVERHQTLPAGRQESEVKSQKWENIGFIAGKGSTSDINHYSFEDKNLLPGKYQYRLKQIDFDGSFEYTDIVEVEINIPNAFSLSQNYPNPFNPATNIEYQIAAEGFVSLTIYNSIGQKVSTLVNENQAAGNYSINFSAEKLPSGLYFYSLRSGDFNETRKMLLLK